MTKRQALTKILKDAQVFNEAGDQVISFDNAHSDSRDFISINRNALLRLMEAAFTAGMEADLPN